MSKLFFIVPPLTGHINPTVSLGHILAQKGHQVAWLGYEESLKRSLPDHYLIYSLDQINESQNDQDTSPIEQHGDQEKRGFSALYHLWESVFIPLARASYPQLIRVLKKEKPDLCIVDQQMLGGALACQQLNIPYITSSTTSAALIQALEGLPQVQAWHQNLLESLWLEHGLKLPSKEQPIDLSPLATLAFSSRRLTLSVTPHQTLPTSIHFVGPALEGERAHVDFPWEKLDTSLPKLFVSMGTVNAFRAEALYKKLIEALGDMNIQVIAAAPKAYFKEAPKHWIIQDRVPQLKVLAHVDAVFCHGGHNTTMEALAFGLPLLIAPIRDDQPVIAEQVKAVGAGLRIHFTRIKVSQLRAKIEILLSCDQLRLSAQELSYELTHAHLNYKKQEKHYNPVQLPKQLGASRASEVIERFL